MKTNVLKIIIAIIVILGIIYIYEKEDKSNRIPSSKLTKVERLESQIEELKEKTPILKKNCLTLIQGMMN